MSRARQQVEIGAPPAAVMAVITDFAAYPSFLPWMRRVEVLRHERSPRPQDIPAWEVRFSIQLIRPLKYTLRLELPEPLHLSWSLVEGIFRSNDGSWVLDALADGQRTLATYEIELLTGSFVPGSVMRSLVGRDLPDLLLRFRNEAERRQGT
ncbi:MAG: hypothetical protein GXP62_15860 [Oligoflexia bacterium]|nr:hypothetical protein [Oligoflexia bacterium]